MMSMMRPKPLSSVLPRAESLLPKILYVVLTT